MFGLSELAILLTVVIVLVGAKRLPDLARNAGKAARILKSENKAMKAEGSAEQQQAPHVIRVRPGDRTAERRDDGTETGNGPGRT
ncbi:twin-arginine translocase TatA/TatE family subunit [Streptomyces cyaneofuscatus]|uniref:twin-arginine translocase TatA/TatE family subunit n=1 Tax=Streptomyces cyaneofuscatus TaxID=66883 RepID=UPI00365EC67B